VTLDTQPGPPPGACLGRATAAHDTVRARRMGLVRRWERQVDDSVRACRRPPFRGEVASTAPQRSRSARWLPTKASRCMPAPTGDPVLAHSCRRAADRLALRLSARDELRRD